ncbi:MAG TPA: retropepsin-like aspartic protease [Pyrinomonadaceae bacterium]
MSKAKLAIALSTLSVAMVAWAVPGSGIAHQRVQRPESTRTATPVAPIRLRDERDRGLLANGWINGAGPFVFVIDTGAGVSLISRNVVERAGLRVTKSRRPLVGGLSTSPISSDQEASISGLALGRSNNNVPGSVSAAVVTSLPGSIDGVLDPTEVFSPLGYTVDLPGRELRVFESRLRVTDVPRDGAVVRWVREAGSDRPFVKLGDGRLALIDTGSGFGLALNGGAGSNHRRSENAVHDLGGGIVQSQRVEPQVVSIGSLVLNRVPTDVLTGVAPGTPIILGRGALFPFRITFDPASRLIAFEPAEHN